MATEKIVKKRLVSAAWTCLGIKSNSQREDKAVHKAGDILEASEGTFASAMEGGVQFEDVTDIKGTEK